MARKRTWTDQQFINAVESEHSVSGVLKRIGLHPTGANYKTVWNTVDRLKIDTKHWTGQGYLKGKTHVGHKKFSLEELMVDKSLYRGGSSALKKRMINDGILENKCSICGNKPEWNGEKLVMVIDHINGNNMDNRRENLRLLCPNCNSQQKTFAGRNKKINRIPEEQIFCIRCGKRLSEKRKTHMCVSCFQKKDILR